jgi:hypothetical protein
MRKGTYAKKENTKEYKHHKIRERGENGERVEKES